MEPSVKAMAQELEEVKKEMNELRVEVEGMKSIFDNEICDYCGKRMSEHEFNEEFKKSVEKAKKDIKEGRGTVLNSPKEVDEYFRKLQED